MTTSTDAASHTIVTTFDTSNNKTNIQDQRGKNWGFTFDGRGNVLTASDPLSDTTTMTYSAHNRVLTVKLPTGEQTVNTYDGNDNLTEVVHKDSSGVTQASESYTLGATGLVTDYYDANTHHYQYGHNANGELTSVTTPDGNVTTWGVEGIGARTSRKDALLRTTTYTRDTWERVRNMSIPMRHFL